MEKLLTAKEISNVLHVSYQTVLNMVYDGRLKAHKPGKKWLFRESEIIEILEQTSST
jgi:excisionase family DNA binding protein